MRKLLEAFNSDEPLRVDYSNPVDDDPRDSACQELLNNRDDWEMICMEYDLDPETTAEYCRDNYGIDPYEEVEMQEDLTENSNNDWDSDIVIKALKSSAEEISDVDPELGKFLNRISDRVSQSYPDFVKYSDLLDILNESWCRSPKFGHLQRMAKEELDFALSGSGIMQEDWEVYEEPEYNEDSVEKEIKKDKRIKGKEGKAIHSLLKGWRGDKKKVTENYDDIMDMHDDGMKPSMIAASLGMTTSAVRAVIDGNENSLTNDPIRPSAASHANAAAAYGRTQLQMSEDDSDVIDCEMEIEWPGDDGEMASGYLHYKANKVNGKYVVDPNSLTGYATNDFNVAKVNDSYIKMLLKDHRDRQEFVDQAQENTDYEYGADPKHTYESDNRGTKPMAINRTKNMRGILNMFENKNHKPDCTCPFCNKDDNVEDQDVDKDEDESEEVKESNHLSTMGSGPNDAGWEKNGRKPRNFKMNKGVKNNSVSFGDDKDGIYEDEDSVVYAENGVGDYMTYCMFDNEGTYSNFINVLGDIGIGTAYPDSGYELIGGGDVPERIKSEMQLITMDVVNQIKQDRDDALLWDGYGGVDYDDEDLDESSQTELDRLIHLAGRQIAEARKIVMNRPTKSKHLKR